ncbi:hypothetical protein KUV57_11405 [Epibacterium sp. DP7N7-1]|nr:hypothetical protein [Epibacterium sp. DP7N7-1]
MTDNEMQMARLRPLYERLAEALAGVDGEEELAAFHRDRHAAESQEENVFLDYVEVVEDMIRDAGLRAAFHVVGQLAGPAPTEQDEPRFDLNQVEDFIAQREVEILDIGGQLDRSEKNSMTERSDAWRGSAKHALTIKRQELVVAHKLRLKILRQSQVGAAKADASIWDDESFANATSIFAAQGKRTKKISSVIDTLEKRLEATLKQKEKERRNRIFQVDRAALARMHLLSCLRLAAPDIVDPVLARCSELQTALGEGRATVSELMKSAKDVAYLETVPVE